MCHDRPLNQFYLPRRNDQLEMSTVQLADRVDFKRTQWLLRGSKLDLQHLHHRSLSLPYPVTAVQDHLQAPS
mgnify:CR=1 FL=1